MRIENTQIQKIFKLHLHKVNSANAQPSSSVRTPDQLTLSRQATEMNDIKQFVSALPDIRQNKVNEVQKKIHSGGYNVPDNDIAEAIFDNAMQSKGI